MSYFFITLIISIFQPNALAISCSEVPLYLKMKSNTEYIYNNLVTIATWPKGNETEKNIKKRTGGFQSITVPTNFNTEQGYFVFEVNIKADDPYFLQILGKNPDKYPANFIIPTNPLGFRDLHDESKPQPIKSVKCKEIFKTKNTYDLFELKTEVSKESINQVLDIKDMKISGKTYEVIQIETRSKVTLSGYLEGKGTETETKILLADTRELVLDTLLFDYQYRIGEPGLRYDEVMKGKYVKTLIKKGKYTPRKVTFYDHIKQTNKVNYFSDKNGIFVPVTINTTLKTNLHFDTASNTSTIGYPYYIENIKSTPKNYFFPFDSLNIGGNIVLYPPFRIEYFYNEKDFDYKIPGKVAGDILSLGIIQINDDKRELSFFDEWNGPHTPENAILFNLKNNVPVFEALLNSSTINTTIGLDCYSHEISYKIKEQLGLKTRKLIKDNIDNQIIEKAQVILTPPHSQYMNIEVVVKDFGDSPYDMKLCLDFLKGKNTIINYLNKWLLITSATRKK